MSRTILAGARNLLAAPEYGDSLAWSDDNVLACGLGSSVYLLNPGDLEGAAATTSLSSTSDAFHDYTVRAPTGVLAQDLWAVRRLAYHSTWPGLARVPGARSMTWSPRGLAPNGAGCLLGLVTSDHQARGDVGGLQFVHCCPDLIMGLMKRASMARIRSRRVQGISLVRHDALLFSQHSILQFVPNLRRC